MPHKFLDHTVILCLERRYPKHNRIIHLKSDIIPLKKLFYPSHILGWLRTNGFGILPSVQSLRNWVYLVALGDQQSLKSATKESKMHLKVNQRSATLISALQIL